MVFAAVVEESAGTGVASPELSVEAVEESGMTV